MIYVNSVTTSENDCISLDWPSGFADMPLESRLDFVVGEEGDVAGVGHRQDLPVLQQAGPRL